MSVAQTLPNLPAFPLWQSLSPQGNNVSYSLEIAQVQLTSAQLLALKTTAIVLVPAPTIPGQVLFVDNALLRLDFNTAAYTLNAGTLKLFYGPVANAHPITADLSTNFITAAASRIIPNIVPIQIAPDTFANIQNQAIYLGNDGSANYTVGNSTVTVTIAFSRTTP